MLYNTSFILALSVVFIINNRLYNGIVSGKHFWFFGCMVLVSLSTLIYAFIKKRTFRVSTIDGFVLLFTGSVFLSACVFNETYANVEKTDMLRFIHYDDVNEIPPMGFPMATSGNFFISCHFPEKKDSLLSNSSIISAEDKMKIIGIQEDDNPTLVFFKIKNF